EAFMTVNVPTIVKATMPGTGAEKAGLKEGDKLVAVNGVATPSFAKFTAELQKNSGKRVPLTLIRDGKSVTAQAEVDGAGKLGFEVLGDFSKLFHTEQHSYSFLESVPRGIEMGCDQLVSYVKAFKTVFSKEGAKNLGGFGSIGHIFPEEWDWYSFWSITAFLSVILAFMNILPIPALDGGHVLFLLYEMITRRKPSIKFMEYAQTAGMIFLIGLLLFANANDIYRFFIK
ncbi:MAG: M50 family metallopeptidase, partial [Bacteroidales bacterium]|nr:M50 family metallopeptidase [Bacteroidales bacterium]